MKPSTKKTLVICAKTFGISVAGSLVAALFVFLVSFVANGMSWLAGLEWVRRILYIIGSIVLIVGAVGMLFSGEEYRGSRIGFNKDEVFAEFKDHAGITWATALILVAFAILLVATASDFFFTGIVKLF